MICCEVRDTPIGKVNIGADGENVLWLRFGDAEATEANKITAEAFRQLEEYFAGKRKIFGLPLKLEGTPFQVKVWEALRQIPYGSTISYGELADMAGCPNGARAVGGAMRENRIPVFIPCHRVITSEGKLGGYSGGLDVKRKLLQLEGVSL